MSKLNVALVLAWLLAPTLTQAAVTPADAKVMVDALTWVDGSYYSSRVSGVASRAQSFAVTTALLGITAQAGSVAALRMQVDVARLFTPVARELYVDLHWFNGLGVRAGQLTPPLGYEALTPLQQLRLLDYSSVRRWLKPRSVQDVGVMLSCDREWFAVAAACLNGSGVGQGVLDNNVWKDFCGRVVFKPGLLPGSGLACRGYYGRTGDAGETFANLAGEAWFEGARVRLAAEVQHAVIGRYVRNGAYIQCSCVLLPWLEPAGRIDAELQVDDRYDVALVVGGNVNIPGERLKLILGYRHAYWATNSIPGGVSSSGVGVRLQVVL